MNALGSVLAGWLIVVAAFDLSSRRVPNWLIGLGLVTGFVGLVADLQPFSVSPISALLTTLATFGVFLIFYATGLMGGGDVKLAAVLGLWFGHELLIQIFVFGSFLACLHALLMLLCRSPGLMQLWPRATKLAGHGRDQDSTKKRQIPYAAYLAIGGLMVFV